QIIEKNGRQSDYVDIEIPCDNLNDRKQLMENQGDAFIALPGGIGTLDEIFTIAASATIGYHSKTVILYNMKGFWDSLIAMLDDLHSRGVTRKQWRTYIKVANSLEELEALLQ
ncbi:MAG: LOG family protein, partial [Prevotella sp.]